MKRFTTATAVQLKWTMIPIILLVVGFASDVFAQRRFEAEVESGIKAHAL